MFMETTTLKPHSGIGTTDQDKNEIEASIARKYFLKHKAHYPDIEIIAKSYII